MQSQPRQLSLFERQLELPEGLLYRNEFLTTKEEAVLLSEFSHLPFHEARFQQYTARRRVVRFVATENSNDFNGVPESPNARIPVPDFLFPLRRRVAQRFGFAETEFAHILITEYKPGTPIGWHRDSRHFECIIGVSLAGSARMRFRPLAARSDRKATVDLLLTPRSVYVMRSAIRWDWQHHIPPSKELRYSITFRTLRQCAHKENTVDVSSLAADK